MPKRPYFSISRDSFEKNAGYKTTVHALAELIDNAYEAEASKVAVVLMVDRESRLRQIATIDDGCGMDGTLLQMAVCEKAGSYLERQRGGGPSSRKKLGKYGVGLPKASISQCNHFTVWSWTNGGPKSALRNHVDITDREWIAGGAEIDVSQSEPAPDKWLKASELDKANSGTMILWNDLDGVTWARARWGARNGLIPNLEFEVGRVYRKLIAEESAPFVVQVYVVNEKFKRQEDPITIKGNDPLYLTPGLGVPRQKLPDGSAWPPDDPLFDDVTGDLQEDPLLNIAMVRAGGKREEVEVSWRASAARKNTFAKFNKLPAGHQLHGLHARRNVGLSLLRENREITLTMALAVPSEPRERWFGVEVEIPHQLDVFLGMTNNKQEYTRLEAVLQHPKENYLDDGESMQMCLERIEREDFALAVCLRIAWKTQEIWRSVKRTHLNMREENKAVGPDGTESDADSKPGDPEAEAEKSASDADSEGAPRPKDKQEMAKAKQEFLQELLNQGVPRTEAEQLSDRIVERGLAYTIASRSGLGSPFFNVRTIKGVKLIELNVDHPVYKYLKSSMDEIGSDDAEALGDRLKNARVATLLLLEAWGRLESGETDIELRRLQRIREDWGRLLDRFIVQFESDLHT